MNTMSQASRVSRLKKRFSDVLAGTVKIDSRGAGLFLEGLCAQDDPVVCLDAIIESVHGLSSVQLAMRSDLSINFMNGLGSVVLEYLLRAPDVGGDALDNVLFHVVEPPIFWSPFIRAFQDGSLKESSQLVFARVLSRLMTLQGRDTTPYRDVASRRSIQETLFSSSSREIRETGHLVKYILTSIPSVSAYDVRNGPGGRHDNDSADFRDIAILPTPDEIMCQKPTFLSTTIYDDLINSETPYSDYLDHTFRILREDMVFDIREAVKIALQKKKENDRGLAVNDVFMTGIYTGADNRKTRWGVKLQCTGSFWQLKGMKEEEDRLEYLTRDPRGSKILRHQSLVCLVSGNDTISLGTINRVDELLACNPPVIVFQPDGAVNAGRTLRSLRAGQVVQLIQLDAATFAFEPVLTALQRMTSVPLARETLFWDSDMPIGHARNSIALSHIAYSLQANCSVEILDLPNITTLDDSQARSMISALKQRVSLIQGPPGTGKSFIGALLAKAIYDETGQTILVVCYTNHALDQFLEDLLKHNISDDSIVRLGGRANRTIEHLSLQRQPRDREYNWENINDLKMMASGHEYQLGSKFNELMNVDDRRLMSYLERKYQEFSDAFYVPFEEDGMTLVGSNGQSVDEKYLFERWKRCQDGGVLKDRPHVRAAARIWSMDRSARRTALDKWRQELTAETVEAICEAGTTFNHLQDNIKEEFAKSTVSILRQKRIIACTTTGAAIYAKAIKKVGPDVLLVEEAGEILESHILTALSPTVDQMVLIGDHKQLRPKVNNYQLTVEKGEGFNLNMSLFERLVLKGYPHETLSTQHRMRPEISAFVRKLTYPELADAPSTFHRPNIRGVQSNVIFVDHAHPEDNDLLIGDRQDGGAKGSKQNTYEVEMVFKIVRYLGQQGYTSENVVVLTPYLGQLYKLRDALKHDHDPILNEMDSLDLARAGLSAFASLDLIPKKTGIKIATIDNYQGEEGHIVIASLTRSNTSNAIGFMDSPERLNVLLSRARDGLILIGNSQTFLHSRKGGALWRRFFALLEEGKYVYQGFPIKCQRHPERTLVLNRAEDFDEHCPDGGCTQPCGFTLLCGHPCTLKCHPDRQNGLVDPHDASECKRKMAAACRVGHIITWECRVSRPACWKCDREAEAKKRRLAEEEEERRKQREEEHVRQMEERRRQEERKKQEEEHRRREEEHRRQEEERKRQEEERRRQEEERKRQEEERRRHEERKRWEEERKRQEEEYRKYEERKRHEEERKRREEERKKREEEQRRRERERVEEIRKSLTQSRLEALSATVSPRQEYEATQMGRPKSESLELPVEKSSSCALQ